MLFPLKALAAAFLEQHADLLHVSRIEEYVIDGGAFADSAKLNKGRVNQ